MKSQVPSVTTAATALYAYCHERNWSGWDPYDALNSPWIGRFPLLDRRVPRLILTQLLKRSPINFRKLLKIPETQNPKALALFLRASLKLRKAGVVSDDPTKYLLQQLITLRAPGTRYFCWGYSFPWQTRTRLVPRGTPNAVCTTFVANALLDVYEDSGDTYLLDMAASAADYLHKELYFEEGDAASFSYPLPGYPSKIHNANLLAAGLLARVHYHTRNHSLVKPAWRAARYSASRQRADGGWVYGELPTQQWIDHFHTGYNLSGLRSFNDFLHTDAFEETIARGLDFYLQHFFRPDGAPRYFHNSTYPIDVHCVAQSILTLVEFRDKAPHIPALLEKVYTWAMSHLWDPQGFFHYRRHRLNTVRIPYMRWSQSWMLLALAALIESQARTQEAPAPVAQTNSVPGTQPVGSTHQ